MNNNSEENAVSDGGDRTLKDDAPTSSDSSLIKRLTHGLYLWVFIPYAVVFLIERLSNLYYGASDYFRIINQFISTYAPSENLEYILLKATGVLEKYYFAIALFIFLFLIYKLYTWARRILTRHQTAHRTQAAISRDYSNFVGAVSLNLPNPGQQIVESDRNKIIDAAATFIQNGTIRLSQLFNHYTGGPTHVSFKSFAPDTGEVRTHHRLVGGGRSLVDDELPSFSYKENTAFVTIIDDRSKSFYYSNNLRSLAKKQLYINRHGNWKNHYNATIVVPATDHQSAVQITKDTVNGFVCVDNRVGKFDKKSCVDILSSFSYQCYNVMQVLGYLEEPRETRNVPPDGGVND